MSYERAFNWTTQASNEDVEQRDNQRLAKRQYNRRNTSTTYSRKRQQQQNKHVKRYNMSNRNNQSNRNYDNERVSRRNVFYNTK